MEAIVSLLLFAGVVVFGAGVLMNVRTIGSAVAHSIELSTLRRHRTAEYVLETGRVLGGVSMHPVCAVTSGNRRRLIASVSMLVMPAPLTRAPSGRPVIALPRPR